MHVITISTDARCKEYKYNKNGQVEVIKEKMQMEDADISPIDD
jgi:hypothetical protein